MLACRSVLAAPPMKSSAPSAAIFRRTSKSCKRPAASHTHSRNTTVRPLTRQLAHKLGGEALYLSSPLMANNAAAAAVIREQEVVGHTLEQVRRADIALVGIGDLDPATSGFVKAGVADAQQLSNYRENGAIGDMAWQIFDSEGALYACELNQRIIGVTLDELRAVPCTIAVAVGLNKAAAILGALRTGAINVLCTDEDTAARMLE